MSIASMDNIVAALSAQERSQICKLLLAQGSAGVWTSTWKVSGIPGAGATPATGSGAVPTEATAGAIQFTDPAGGTNKHLLAMAMCATQRAAIILVDRLVHTSGLSGTVTTAQTVNSTALPSRDRNGSSNGVGVEAWLEVYSALGSTSRTVTVSYTNQAGTSGQSGSATIPASAPANRIIPVTLAAGDTGVRSVENLTLSGTTGTAGDFGVTLLRRISFADIMNASGPSTRGVFDLGMPRLYADSCLSLIALFDASTSASIFGELVMGEG